MNKESKKIIIKNNVLHIISIICILAIVNFINPIRIVNATMKVPSVEEFNIKFERYLGKQSTAYVKALVSAIISNNATTNRVVKFNGLDDLKSIQEKLYNEYNDDNQLYEIKAEYDETTGYITNIRVLKNGLKDVSNLKTIIYIMFFINFILLFIILIIVIKINKKKKVNIK